MSPTVQASATGRVDVQVMRETVILLLTPGSEAPAGVELATLTATVRGYMEFIGPEVEIAAGKLPKDDIPRYCAFACVGEARDKLRAHALPGPNGAYAHARRLARSLAALCDHYEALTGVTMCVACDKRITPEDTSIPYDPVSASGGAASSGRIHTHCADTTPDH
ncbi:DUF6415 family natural product biosynthesis protein [Streptomyces sp. NBC_00203]|uniref:DUF6415 family natural product biosynthesis protein n=1 Tax=Streptomyces sp. NBC_00203 TaxID=2975680 RepID=UPI00324A3B96